MIIDDDNLRVGVGGDLQWGTWWGAGGSGANVGNATAGTTNND